jgi:threonine dehydrogenase-like Zn-dependent dehydrogenase
VINNLGAVEITVVDKNNTRAEYALECGASKILFDADTLQKDFFDVVVDATGVIPVMRKTLDYVRYGGMILLFGVPPSGKIMEIEPFVIFRKGLKILSSYTSLRNSYQAVSLLKSGKISVGDLVSHKLPLEEFQRGVEMIENSVENVRKVMILPNE